MEMEKTPKIVTRPGRSSRRCQQGTKYINAGIIRLGGLCLETYIKTQKLAVLEKNCGLTHS